jgi:hypothetical protein
MNGFSVDEMRAQLVDMIRSVPVKDDLFGFNIDGIQMGENLLTQAEKDELIEKLRSAQLSKEAARRVFAAVSGALKLAILVL